MKRETLILILFFLSGILFFIFIFPKYQEYQNFTRALEEKTNIKNILTRNLAAFQEIESKMENYKEIIEKITLFQDEKELAPSLIYFLQKEADSTGVLIGSVNFGDILKDEAESKELPFEIKISSSYGSLLSFLKKLEGSAVIFKFDNISIEKKGEEDILNVSLAGKIIF